MIIHNSQLSILRYSKLNVFALKMVESIILNLELPINSKDAQFVKKVELAIATAIDKYLIVSEEYIEDYLLLYFHFSVLQQDNKPSKLIGILCDDLKKEKMKLEELTAYLISNS
jgi:hypothetical protein